MPCWLTGIIDSVDNSDTDGKKIGFYGGHYRFDTTLPQGLMPYPFLANIGYYRFDGFLSGPKGIEELSLVVRSGIRLSMSLGHPWICTGKPVGKPAGH